MSAPDNEAGIARKVLRVAETEAGLRLDRWLALHLSPDLSRNRLQALIRSGKVAVAGAAASDPARPMAAGEVAEVRIPPVRPAGPAAEPIPLDVLFEDDDIIVLNKAAGLVVHPGAGNPDGTLVNALIAHCGKSLSGVGGVGRPGIVHRLDKDTSGVLVVAKSDPAHHALSAAFADHGRSGDLERAYQALVWGVPKGRGTVDAPLGRARGDRTRRAVVSAAAPDARRAVTHYAVVERFGAEQSGAEQGVAALVECRLETGRTHQIRVHMAHIGHPLVGDRDYGRGFLSKANRLPATLKEKVLSFPRQALHARLLAFPHPRTHIRMCFEAPMPPDMDALVRSFRAGS